MPMLLYQFVTQLNDKEKNEVLGLYQKQGWWPECRLNPDYLEKTINGSHCVLVAMYHTMIVGMGRAISDSSGDAYLHDITVKKEFRNRGVGSAIVLKLIDRLKQDGITWIGLIAENKSAPFYKSQGFSPMDNSDPMFFESK